jgi:hypothetical protein
MFSFHAFNRKTKKNSRTYSEESSQRADNPQHNITTTVEQQTTHDM